MEAKKLLYEGLKLNEQFGVRHGIADAYSKLAKLAGLEGDKENQLQLEEASYSINRHIGRLRAVASNVTNLIGLLRGSKDQEKLRKLYVEFCEVSEKLSDRIALADGYRQLGDFDRRNSKLDDAESAYRNALSIYTELGHDSGTANVLFNLGDIKHAQGKSADARGLWIKSSSIYAKSRKFEEVRKVQLRLDSPSVASQGLMV